MMKSSSMMIYRLLLAKLILLASISAAASQIITKPGCPATCGNLSIPYPFGTTSDCYLDSSFFINCTTVENTTIPLLQQDNIRVSNISLDGEVLVLVPRAYDCYDPRTRLRTQHRPSSLNVVRFPISSTRNRFTVVGCDTVALIQGSDGRNYTTGCVALCDSIGSISNGTCAGSGCCQTSIPAGARNFGMDLSSIYNHTNVSDFNTCGFAFVVEEESYKFSSLDLRNLRGIRSFPVVLDWAVSNVTCEEAQHNRSSYACQSLNSQCVNSADGLGYHCNCTAGYGGNPYLSEGCQAIDECDPSSPSPCAENGICRSSEGRYLCSCPEGYTGDGRTTGCTRRSESKGSTLLKVALGTSIGLLVLVVANSWVCWIMKRRKMMRVRDKFFEQNGGFILKQQISKHEVASQAARIFTLEDLKKATNNYEESRIIGQGGFGTVYKGVILPDNREVAIKKSRISDQSQIEQFINEVVVLSQINHRNVVKLLGCCLESEVPLLVYEFIRNGTLSDQLHEKRSESKSLSWGMRLKIAVETAEAIAYLHSATSMPIIHRDIKSTNILLDESYTAKVSDFGASKLVPLDHTQLTTLVQGTFGYLDPEYFHSSQLTDKSDVYSFGVVLAELLTGERALSFDRPEKDRNLAMYFVNGVDEDRLADILDDDIAKEGDYEQIKEVAVVAKRCLRVKGEKRPSMKEVARELEGLRSKAQKHPWVDTDMNTEETEHLLDQIVPSNAYNGSGTGAEYDTMINQIPAALHDGR